MLAFNWMSVVKILPELAFSEKPLLVENTNGVDQQEPGLQQGPQSKGHDNLNLEKMFCNIQGLKNKFKLDMSNFWGLPRAAQDLMH